MKNNPFYKNYNLPYDTFPFNEVKTEHFIPAIKEGMELANKNYDAICNCKDEPTFENTILPFETANEDLNVVVGMYWHLFGANSDNEFKRLAQQISPMLSDHNSKILLNKTLFDKIKSVYDNMENNNYDIHDTKLIKDTYKSFVRNGAALEEKDKNKLKDINKELSTLSPQFSNNVLDAQNSFELWITNEDDLAGLPSNAINGAKMAAKAKKKDNEWLFTLQMPSFMPFMTYSSKRHLREQMAKAQGSLCNGGKYNNNEIVKKIVSLKHEKSKLLGYDNHADFILEERMAENVDNVYKLLDNLYNYSYSAANKELDEIKDFAKQLDNIESFKPWDLMYYKEKLKKDKYDFDSETLRPYFKSENVIDGVFQVAQKLYGLKFNEKEDIQTWHKDVKCYEVCENNGDYVGFLYIDLYPRETKRSGAWMNPILENGLFKGKIRRPQVVFVCNLSPSTEDKPSLLTYSEVETIFHEFGHCLHGLLSDGKYQTTSGTNVFWDFVELPSQIMENWVGESETLKLFANHYETGETLPDHLIDKIKKSSSFGAGYISLRQLSLGYLDMAWHTHTGDIDNVEEFENKAVEKTRLFDHIPGSAISTTFGHIFSGGYSAGYYSYKWAEVLDADAFEKFKEDGIFNTNTASSFRANILSKGSLMHPMELYKSFRGREPKVEALLKRDKLI